jgi:flagellar biosynthesis protein FlhA
MVTPLHAKKLTSRWSGEGMPADDRSNTAATRWTALVLPITIVGAILVLLVPLPAGVLDLLLSANITLAVLVLLTVLSIRTPQEFSAFPTILVTTTLTRLVLNVAVTRRVLTYGGTQGLDAAGHVIRAFGDFVAADQVIVGAILFAILVIIQFVVITKGATRISEVAARFMLDGLPGRQMAIDADLHAGLIDQHQAASRRDALYRQADFFGAMDGAGKFVRGDAVAGVLITFVNIIAGLYLGVMRDGMPIADAVDVFTRLTIGDGLVSQVPAFLIALAAGLIVTRSSSESDLGREVTGQLFGRAEVLGVASVFLVLLSFTGLPRVPLLTIAGALGVASYVAFRATSSIDGDDADEPSRPSPRKAALTARPGPAPGHGAAPSLERDLMAAVAASASPEAMTATARDHVEDLLQVDPLELEIGYRLIPLTEPGRGDLLERVRMVRQRIARELGLVVPQVRVRDELGLGPHDYRLKIRGAVAARGIAYAGRLLAIPPAGLVSRPDGRDGIDPATGQPAVWIHADGREVAELSGCRILEAPAAIAAHFAEILLDHADELVSHEQVRQLLDRVRASTPSLVEEVVPRLMRVGELQRVLQGLVRERVSVRDLEVILEALADHAGSTRDTSALVEDVRRALGRRLVQGHLGADGRLHAVSTPSALDAALVAADADPSTRGPDARALVRAVADAIAPLLESGSHPVLLCGSAARPLLKDLTRPDLPRLVVLARREVPRDVPIELVGSVVWSPEAASAAPAGRVVFEVPPLLRAEPGRPAASAGPHPHPHANAQVRPIPMSTSSDHDEMSVRRIVPRTGFPTDQAPE